MKNLFISVIILVGFLTITIILWVIQTSLHDTHTAAWLVRDTWQGRFLLTRNHNTSAIQNQVKESLNSVRYIDIPMTLVNYTMNGKGYIIHVNQGIINNKVALVSRDDPKLNGCNFRFEYNSSQHHCGDPLYWNNTTQDTSSSRTDCQIIVDFLTNNEPHHTWYCGYVDFYSFDLGTLTIPLVEYNSCCFGITMWDSIAEGLIGDQDIATLISDAMNKYPGSDKIGATGSSMLCADTYPNITSGTANTSWAIYNPYTIQDPSPTGVI